VPDDNEEELLPPPPEATVTTAGRWAVASGSATHPEGAVLPTPEEDDQEEPE
jgi:hypothetical protein